MKKNEIKLVCGEESIVLTIERAQATLQIQKEMGKSTWGIPEDSPYQFVNNGIVKRSNTKDSKVSKPAAGD